MTKSRAFLSLAAAMIVLVGCDRDPDDADSGGDGDADSDMDSAPDGDGDGDTDADIDGDGDGGGQGIICDVSPWGLECCDASGARLGTSDCVEGSLVCRVGAHCECEGVAMAYACSDICGSDIIAFPSCVDGSWQCVSPRAQRTDECPAGTCWGDPGECACCENEGRGDPVTPDCTDGEWLCPPGAAFCRSCQD